MRLIAIATLLAATAGCPGHVQRPYAPVDVEGSNLYKTALRAMVSAGLTVEEKDAEAGIVASEWEREFPELRDVRTEYRYRVVVDEGEATVMIDCRPANECESGKRPEARLAMMQRIAAELR